MAEYLTDENDDEVFGLVLKAGAAKTLRLYSTEGCSVALINACRADFAEEAPTGEADELSAANGQEMLDADGVEIKVGAGAWEAVTGFDNAVDLAPIAAGGYSEFQIKTTLAYNAIAFGIAIRAKSLYTPDEYFAFTPGLNRITDYYPTGASGLLPLVLNPSLPPSIGGVPVLEIYQYAFQYKSLTGITFSEGVTNFGVFCFAHNDINGTVRIPASLRSAFNSAFAYNKIDEVIFEDGLVTMGQSMFVSNEIIRVILPDTLTSIGVLAFYVNTGLAYIEIPAAVTLSSASLPDGFMTLYNGNGQLAGTYELISGTWTKTA